MTNEYFSPQLLKILYFIALVFKILLPTFQKRVQTTHIIVLCVNFRYESIHFYLIYYTLTADKNLINNENYSQQTYKKL